MQEVIQQLLDIIRSTWRYRWLAVAIAWPLALGGWYFVHDMPDEYEASSRVYVDTQTLLQPLLGNMTIRPRVEQQLQLMTRTLFSRPNLEQVVRSSDLDLTVDSEQELEQLVTRLRGEISLRSAGRENLYTISYSDNDPQQARAVVQAMLDQFVEGSLGNTREDLASSQQFIDEQIAMYEVRLDGIEDQIKDFQREHFQIIESGGDYYGRLENAERQLAEARLQLQEAERRRDALQSTVEGAQPVLLPQDPREGATRFDSRIAELESRLDQLRTRYTDQHPDVQSTERILEDLQARRQQALAARNSSSQGIGQEAGQYVQQLQFALADAESQVASLRARVEEYRQRYEGLRARVDEIPEVEAQYQALRRDRDVLKRNYERLLETRERASLTGELENRPQRAEFRVIDPPFVPGSPSGPNRVALAGGVMLLSLGGGAGLAFLIGQVRPTVNSRFGLQRLSSRPMLGSVSLNEPPRRAVWRRMRLAGFFACVLLLPAAYGGLATFYTLA